MNAFKSARSPRPLSLVIAIVGVLAWMPGGIAIAQDAPVNPAEGATEKDTTELNAVIVIANKRDEDILAVPSSISVINEQQLDNLHATQLSDLQADVPAFSSTAMVRPERPTSRCAASRRFLPAQRLVVSR